MKEKLGSFKKDKSGLFHYRHESGGSVCSAVEIALSIRPRTKPCWFWFGGTPAQMVKGDTPETLYRRWLEWRDAYQKDPELFFQILQDLV